MGFFKVLGGVALGVGAVAAAPFTGGGSLVGAATLAGSLAGAGTVAAAVGAGAAGAAAGYALNEKEEEERRREIEKAREDTRKAADIVWKEEITKLKKEHQETITEWQNEFQGIKQGTHEHYDFCRQVTAMFGIGVAVAYADGEFSQAEEDEMDNFILGASAAALPRETVEAITLLKTNPPAFDTAIEKAKAANVKSMLVDAIINLIAKADDEITPEEQNFIDAWNTNHKDKYVQ